MLESIKKLRDYELLSVFKSGDELADEIEREIAEKYMKLPVDADGVPWHIGDVTENGNTVNAITFDRIGAHFTSTLNDIVPSIHTHAKPRTADDVLRDVMTDFADADFRDETIEIITARYIGELREMLGGDA